jgi:hypothetical protein
MSRNTVAAPRRTKYSVRSPWLHPAYRAVLMAALTAVLGSLTDTTHARAAVPVAGQTQIRTIHIEVGVGLQIINSS